MHGAVRSAGAADLDRVARLLENRGEIVAAESLYARIEDEDGGILLGRNSTVSWKLDAGALYLYDLAGDPAEVPALLAVAEATARARFAAVLSLTVYEDDEVLDDLLASGFVEDWSETDVREGEPARLLSLAREVS
jgi:hypothetical protein